MTTPTRSERVRFGMFEADLRSGELRKQGVKIKLHEQPFQILTMLLEHPGEIVTRVELQRRLWPSGTFVDFEIGLNSAVKKLREALQDSAGSPRYVETLQRQGYRFIAPLSKASSSQAAEGLEPPAEEKSSAGRAMSKVASSVHSRWMLWATAAVLVTLLALLLGLNAGGWRQRLLAGAAPAHIRSIAVLPLESLSGDPGQEYFADGMTDALITDLAQISSLKVISRTSVVRYKGTRKPLPEIAKELNVDGIVEGVVIRSGDRLRIDAQLIDATTDRHLWASKYEGSLGDVIALQNELARAIANAIQLQLTPQQHVRLMQTQSVDPQTYDLYLKGRYFWGQRGEASVQKSINYFQQAIQRDPNYALAYAGMAEAYVIRRDLSPEEEFSKAKAMARVALQMDEGLAEAHNALAMSLFLYDWDWAAAEKEFQRAIVLNPNYAMAHQWYGQFQKAMGRQNWADEVKLAGELDPLSPVTAGGGWYKESGQYDLAIQIQRQKLEIDPNFAGLHSALGELYTRKGMYQDAIAELQKGVTLSGGTPGSLAALGYAYGVSGKRDEASKILRQLSLLSKRRYVSPYDIAMVYVGLGEKDVAFDWLQKAVADHSSSLVFLEFREAGGGGLDSLRSDPRYTELERRIGLPHSSDGNDPVARK